MNKFYDRENQRIVYMSKAHVTPAFWDTFWDNADMEAVFNHPPKHRNLLRTTKKYLPVSARILEGGCGMAVTVFALDRAGFDAYGVDSAEHTVGLVKKQWPHLKISCEDVRTLSFPDNFSMGTGLSG